MKFINKLLPLFLATYMGIQLNCSPSGLNHSKDTGPGSIAYLNKKRKEISTPKQAQNLIDILKYDYEDVQINSDTGEVYNYEVDSPKTTLKEGKAHCYEGALLAAYLLGDDGYGDKILLMYSTKLGHGVYIYKDKTTNLWGAVGQSRKKYLKSREPKYKTIKELVESYNNTLKKDIRLKEIKFTRYRVQSVSEEFPVDWATRDGPLIKVKLH